MQFCRHGGTGGQIFRKNQLVELDGFHRGVVLRQGSVVESYPQPLAQAAVNAFRPKGFGDKIITAGLEVMIAFMSQNGGRSGDDFGGGGGEGFHHLPGGFDTPGFAHPHVEENDLRPGNADNFNRLAAVFSKHHFTANHRQHGGKHVAVFRDVIHHKGPDVLSRAEAEDIAGWQRGSGW